MKRFLKSSLSLVLALTIVLSSALVGLGEIDFGEFFAVKAEAASESELKFALNDDGESYYVSGVEYSDITKAVIPSTYNGLPVTSIGDEAFYKCTSLTSVTIPDGVTSIGDWAFSWCEGLTSVTIPDSVTSIGDAAFYNCKSLTSVTIPNSVISIGASAFLYCKSLTSITIPDSVTSIGDGAFSWCESLTSVTIPNSVTIIADNAFSDCTSLTSVTIPDSVTSIGDGAFEGCSSLTSVTIPDSVTSIGSWAFEDCTSLTSVTIHDSVTSIGDDAFYGTAYYYDSSNWVDGVLYIGNHLIEAKYTINGDYIIKDGTKTIAEEAFSWCESLTSVTIPDSVTSIGERAFNYCTSLTSITIPGSITSIGYWAFDGCNSLIAINVDANNKNYSSVNGVLFNKDKTVIIQYPAGKADTEYTIPDSVTSIGDWAFYYCTSLTSVTIPDSVTSIGQSAFEGCTSLTSITIPNSVTSIGDLAFYNCTSLTSVTIPDSVKIIGISAFSYCTSLTSITIPNSATSIGERAFYDCTSLTSVTIPNSVTSIGTMAFGYYYGEYYEVRKIDGFTIYGISGSAAENYANANGFIFYDLQTKLSAPKLTKIENASSGIKITWSKVTGAQSYNVYRKTYSNGKWSGWSGIKYGITGTSYTDTTAKSGVTYTYTVRAKNAAGLSSYNTTGLKYKFLSTPKLTSISNGSGKVTVKWNKVTGASGYYVYRQTYSNGKWSGWKKVATTSNNYYNDTKVSSGNYYKYTVRAYNGNYISYYNTTGLKTKYLAVAPLKSAVSQSAGVKVTWGKVTGAKGYNIYRQTYSNGKWSGWSKVATVKSGSTVTYTDKSAKKGVTYKYTVRATSDSYIGYYNTKGLQVKDKY